MDPKQTVFDQFLKQITEGKSEEEIGETLKALVEFQSSALYEVIGQMLTDEDFDAIEKIEDDQLAETELIRRFQIRVGMTPQEFADKLRDTLSTEYLKKSS
jgi:hypothetical protein